MGLIIDPVYFTLTGIIFVVVLCIVVFVFSLIYLYKNFSRLLRKRVDQDFSNGLAPFGSHRRDNIAVRSGNFHV